MKVSQKQVLAAYAKMKKMAYGAYESNNLELCFKHISSAAAFAYSYNFVFKDDEFEVLLNKISNKILLHGVDCATNDDSYVMVDGFGRPNRGLTQQYLRSFAKMNIKLYYISVNPEESKRKVYDEINEYENVELILVPKVVDAKKIEFIFREILKIKPSKIFAHIAPWDVVVTTVLYALNKKVERYNINLTDHAFWLGAGCFDYTLEFREYGCSLSLSKRNFKREQILLNPFYPIITDTSFLGFPHEAKDKLIFFSGGSLYKIYGENRMFLDVMKHILDIVPNSVILYAGEGDFKPIKQFIRDNDLKDRLLLLGTRKDINQVFAHCDIYLDTYPISGGLMRQYAAFNAKPVMSFSNKYVCNKKVENIFYGTSDDPHLKVFTNWDDYYAEVLLLAADPNYRNSKGNALKEMMISSELFDMNFKALLKDRKYWNTECFRINEKQIFTNYLNLNNLYVTSVGMSLYKSYKVKTFFYFPRIAIKYIGALLQFFLMKLSKM